ncbi:ferritin-like domain-containing protein [Actinomadura decatromicini]|uniref:Ferritin-like domain-containing protein n=1 Tax=Actinomadura decatromicini TaxID=2604572 RepID=A0A5D3FCZ6_9ACTN|nr:ferritin-like domain-containing protein [Actinomadura decatromicini]TYK46767.1 ferritin-like domain-containing protein [Actinomadura decatromicini]
MTQDFDLDRYVRSSKAVDLSGVAWHEIPSHPVSGAEARTLTFMMDIETHTVMYARDLLATRAAFDPEITAFMSCWIYEEFWHGEAFSRFLGEAGFTLAPDRERVGVRSRYPTKVARNERIRRALGRGVYTGHLASMLGSALTRDFIAIHMTWGAMNELSAIHSYQAMIDKSDNPVLRDILRRVIKDERRHFAFYRAQARLRLERSARARRLARFAMERLWAPVGTGLRPQEESDFALVWLFGDDAGLDRLRGIDATIARLPGFSDATLAQDARRRSLERVPRDRIPQMASDWALAHAGVHRERAA